MFSVHGGTSTPQTALDYFRHYNAIDPRVGRALATPKELWSHCHEQFDEDFVANSPFYQEFLIPHGGRYASANVLIDNDEVIFLLAMMRGYGKQPLTAEDLPLLNQFRHHFAEHRAAALDPFIIAECFDFTPAEARVAIQLTAGDSSKEIARRSSAALPTVRTQNQCVMEKAGVNRQADLVRMLLSLPTRF